ncbi:unnamed protein product [Mytilus edulis]|uniref:Uncharacterized protein n=1 Tax=Mytilus edulis TaxID=6550 RepID=A0A8S3TRB0_MYTED|nr:unnamed protein product [Mytilus edulis]
MHPFIWYIFESVQLRKKHETFCYYEDVIDSEKPYGLVRGLRKFLYSGDRENNESGGQPLPLNADNPVNAADEDITNDTLLKQPVNPEQPQNAPTDGPTGQSESEPTIAILDVIEYVPIFRFSVVITKLDNSKYLTEFVSTLNDFNIPKIVSIFSQSSPNEDIQKHKEEIKTLISVYNEKVKNKTSNDKQYEGDFCWKKLKICFGKNAGEIEKSNDQKNEGENQKSKIE